MPNASPSAPPFDAAELTERLDAIEARLAAVNDGIETLGERLDGGASVRGALGVKEAARALGVGRTTLYKLIRSGDIRPVKVRGRVLVPRAQINAVLRHGTA